MSTCPSCGRANESTSLFCRYCGERLTEPPPRREQRKTVTILVCDLVQSTELADRDPEAFRRVQARYFDRMRLIVERHGGTVEKFIGDEVMAVFGVPTGHEDDALRAARAAAEMQQGLDALNQELDASLGLRLAARIGINTGEVLAGDPSEGHAFVAGEPVIVAKRLQQAAKAGEILIGDATYALVEHAVDAGPLERVPVKGKQDEVGRRRLEAVHPGAPGVARRLQAPMVGRDEELALLQDAFERTVRESSCRLFALVGPAGIGKSRLVAEFFSWIGGRAVVATGHCLSYGEGITFWSLAEMLRELGGEPSLREGLDADDARDTILEVLRGATGNTEARSLEETFWAVRRVFQALARRQPLVVCFEDVHWAEPAILDLIEYIVAWSRDVPILVVALGRPELAEQRPQWLTPRPDGDALDLQPLSSDAADSLLVGAAPASTLSAESRRRIVTAAEGNPLFVEQMSAMVAEHDGELSIPPSIQALLTERLDRLTTEERDVIERASIVGRDFPVRAVAALFSAGDRGLVTPQLFALVRKGLMRPEPTPSSRPGPVQLPARARTGGGIRRDVQRASRGAPRALRRLARGTRAGTGARGAGRIPPRAGLLPPARGRRRRRTHAPHRAAGERTPRFGGLTRARPQRRPCRAEPPPAGDRTPPGRRGGRRGKTRSLPGALPLRRPRRSRRLGPRHGGACPRRRGRRRGTARADHARPHRSADAG